MKFLVDEIRSHLSTMAPHQRSRLTAQQLQQAADCISALTAEVQQLRAAAVSQESSSFSLRESSPVSTTRTDTRLVELSYDVEGVLASAADSTWVTVGDDYAVYIKKDSDGVSAAIYVNGMEDCGAMAECWATDVDVNDMRCNYGEQE